MTTEAEKPAQPTGERPGPAAPRTPQQQGSDEPAGQMNGTAEPAPQPQDQPVYRDWAAI